MGAGPAMACVHIGTSDNGVIKDRIRYCFIFLIRLSGILFLTSLLFPQKNSLVI